MAVPVLAIAGRAVATGAVRSLTGALQAGAGGVEIEFDTNASEVERWIQWVFRDQLPFATSRAINSTAYDARDEIRKGIDERFTIRRRWVVNAIQIPRGGRATKRKLEAVVLIDHRRKFLFKFEEGGTKRGTPDMPIAIPTEHIRPVPTKVPPQALYPKNLRLQARRDIDGGMLAARTKLTRKGAVQWKGKRRTFVIDPQHHRADRELWGVWQRTGPKRHQIRLIWAYRREIPIPNTLQFEATGKRVVDERWDINFARAFDRAIRTARRR